MRIIAINGFKRSGKGETGEAIKRLLPHTLTMGFADKVKSIGAKTLGFVDRSEEECIALMDVYKEWAWIDIRPSRTRFVKALDGEWEGDLMEYHHLTGRDYLQNLGTQSRIVFGDDFWVDQVLPRVNVLDDLNPRDRVDLNYPEWATLVFTDCRFPNEAQRVLDLGGEVWEVLRPGTASDGHASEQVLPRELITRQINNSRSLKDLEWEVNKALELAGAMA